MLGAKLSQIKNFVDPATIPENKVIVEFAINSSKE